MIRLFLCVFVVGGCEGSGPTVVVPSEVVPDVSSESKRAPVVETAENKLAGRELDSLITPNGETRFLGNDIGVVAIDVASNVRKQITVAGDVPKVCLNWPSQARDVPVEISTDGKNLYFEHRARCGHEEIVTRHFVVISTTLN